MATDTTRQLEASRRFRVEPWLPVLLVLTGAVAYLNSFAAGFVWDDTHDIVLNQRLHGILTAVEPPWSGGSYRPVAYLTFALNYAHGGVSEVWSYRLFNVAIHLAAGLALYGIVRRTLLLPSIPERCRRAAPWLALATALLWTVHPLQTEAVTYIVHRYESLMGLFYLLTLYCVLRGATAEAHARWWYAGAVVSCALGMGSKEVMATAPLLVLTYDRVFLAASWRDVFTRRGALYLGLAATWVILYFPILGALNGTERWAGFQREHLPMLPYLLTQPAVILYYLRLALWPDHLCIDLGWPAVDLSRFGETWPQIVVPALIVGALLAGTIYALFRRPWLGFVGLWFFGILSVTSSIMPVADLAAERRMYLSLAAVCLLVALAGWWLHEWVRQRWNLSPSQAATLTGVVAIAVVAALSLRTGKRNEDYYTEESIWRNVVAERPENPRGHANLAAVLLHRGAIDEAFVELDTALRLNPTARTAHRSLGMAFERLGKDDRAFAHFLRAVADDPADFLAHQSLGEQYQKRGELGLAEEHYRTVLRFVPESAEAHYRLGTVYWEQGRAAEAKQEYLTAITLKPEYPEAYDSLALFFWETGEAEGAMRNWHRALEYQPQLASAHNHLGAALAVQGKLDEARPHLQNALALKPEIARRTAGLDSLAQIVRSQSQPAEAHDRIGKYLFDSGKVREAKPHYKAALRLNPNLAVAHEHYATLLWALRNPTEAMQHWQRALEIDPHLAAAHHHLGAALATQDKLDEALRHFDEAVKYDVSLAEAHYHRAILLVRKDRLQDAVTAYRHAVNLRPTNADYRCGLAQTLYMLGQKEAARKEYDEALRQDASWLTRTQRDAWVLAVHPDARQRNARRALQLAERVCQAADPPSVLNLDVLAAALAENGRFSEAVAKASQAAEQAQRDGLKNLVDPIERRAALYRQNKPFRAATDGAFTPGSE